MNIYWPVFKNLESEFSKLMYDIHIDDEQLKVYSSKISDLILRASIEIESISKELYWKNGGTEKGQIKYDDVALDFLINKWSLDKKVVLISALNCFQTIKTLIPFEKNEIRTGGTKYTFSWNNAYQNIKHDRAKSLKFGSIKYLFDILSALYILNIYYSDKLMPLEKDDSQGLNASPNIGSDIFSVVIAPFGGRSAGDIYTKGKDFEKAIYYIDFTDSTTKKFNEVMDSFNEKFNEIAFKNPKISEYLNRVDPTNLKPNWMSEALGDNYIDVIREVHQFHPINYNQFRYEAKLNKNEI